MTHAATTYAIVEYNARRWITANDRVLAAYNLNDLRAYLFPLYTPNGALVLQEAPPDHPHHQGLWCGLEIDGHDLWNAGSFGKPRHRQVSAQPLNAIDVQLTEAGVQLAHQLHWCTAAGEALLQEERAVQIAAHSEFTLVQWRSVFSHPAQAIELGQTKEAGIAVRVPPHWESAFGGRIRNAHGASGEAATFDQLSPWINVEGAALGDTQAGIVLATGADSEAVPWFTRDYGIHIYNPARHRPFHLAAGESISWAVNVLAYDGARSIAQINAWLAAL